MAGNCGWKIKGRTRCGQPAVTNRDLGPSYGRLRLQPVCKVHANFVDANERLRRKLPGDQDGS